MNSFFYGNWVFQPNLETRLSTRRRAQALEMKNPNELWGASSCGWLRPQQGKGQDGEERLQPQPVQTVAEHSPAPPVSWLLFSQHPWSVSKGSAKANK